MPKYYTPRTTIRFANVDAAAFKSAVMTVEVCVHVTSDKGLSDKYYSGVIRYRRDDWKRYTVVWLYGDSVGSDVQEFVQPSISDASCSTYLENYHLTDPSAPDPVFLTGSNFISGTNVYLSGQLTPSAFIDNNHIQVNLTGWHSEEAGVPVRVIRPDFLSSTVYGGFSFELRPVVTGTSQTGTFIDGDVPVSILGDHLKPFSNVRFTSGTASIWSNNSTFESTASVGVVVPALPATGVYAFQVESPSSLSSSIVAASHITASYRRPVITAILPFNTGSIAGTSSFSIIGGYFLSGAQVFFGASGALSQSRISSQLVEVLSPGHGSGSVNVTVVNTDDGQTSVGFPFQYVVPLPTITDVNFNGNTDFTRKTGSAGSDLFVTGTNFTGSDSSMTVTSVTLISGAFVTASTNFTILSPLEISYTIPVLTTGSHYDVQVSNSAGAVTFTNAFEYQDIPVITSIQPVSGTIAGGLFVLVNGRPFYTGASQVKFSGVLGTGQIVYSVNQMSAVTPAAGDPEGGAVNVSVQNYGSIEGSLANAFEYVPFPTASYIRSAKGNNRVPAETISPVTLVGTRLMADKVGARGTVIQLGDGSGPISSSIITSFIDKTQVSFNVQPHLAGFIDLTATNRDVAVSLPLASAVEYVNTPTITSISPFAVNLLGGTTVGVTGTNFINSTDTVVFVGTTQVAAAVANSTHLTFIAPALVASTYNTTIVNRSTTTSNAATIQYIPTPQINSLSISSGTNTGGTTVFIDGLGFISGSTTVILNGAGITFPAGNTPAVNYTSPTQISFVTPPTTALQIGYISLTASVLGLTASIYPAFRYDQQPAINSLTPSTALTGGTTTVTISGSGFINGVSIVAVGGVGIASTFVNSSNITFVAPAHAVGSTSVSVTNLFLSASTNTLYYAALPPPVISNVIVGGVTCGTSGDAKWSTNGGSVHLTGGYGDQLWGNNFTPADVISIIPLDGSPTMFPGVLYVSPTVVKFTMPAHAFGSGYIAIGNINGVSNYALFKWNPIPTQTSTTPTFGAYNQTTAIQITGSNFISGETYVRLPNGFQMNASVLSPTVLSFNMPPTYNSSIDQWPVSWTVVNSSSVNNEAYSGFSILFKTVNPPAVNSLTPANPAAPGGGLTFLMVPTDKTYLGVNLHWYFDYALTDEGLTNNTTGWPGNPLATGSLNIAPPHAAGSVPVWFGYTNEVGSKFVSTGLPAALSYFTPLPITVTVTNTVSDYTHRYTAGYVGTPTISTAPLLYVTASGGVPPYTASLEQMSTSGPSPTLALSYSSPSGYVRAVRGYGPVFYNDTFTENQSTFRWKIEDSLGVIAYSPIVYVTYLLQPW